MNDFYDTSVLVAAFWGDHADHARSLSRFAGATRETSACAAHTLAEVYSVTTRLPVRPRIAPEQAMLFLEDIRERLSIVMLSADEYFATIQQAASRGISGGRIYDALLLRCASKIDAKAVYTWNLDHFRQIAPDLADQIQAP